MILPISPDSSIIVRAAAATALILHIGSGGSALLSGATALVVTKGGRLHRMSGNIFFCSMLLMSAIGAVVAALFPNRLTVVAGCLAFYLVLTGWMTVCRLRNGRALSQWMALGMATVVAASGIFLGWQGSRNPHGLIDGLPYQPAYVFGFIAALGAAMDVRVIFAKGIASGSRIARHVWRMCVAMLIATTSFFQGQQQVFPKFLQDSPTLWAPSLAVLAAMLFWLVRAQFTRKFRATATSPG
jgi:uncharacterized membrane protein